MGALLTFACTRTLLPQSTDAIPGQSSFFSLPLDVRDKM